MLNKEFLDLLKAIHSETNQIKSYHNNSYFMFIGFVFTTLGIFLSFKELHYWNSIIFLGAIFFLLLGLILYFWHSQIIISKYEDMYFITAKGIDENKYPKKEMGDIQKESNKEKKLKCFYKFFLNFGLTLVFLGIIVLGINL